MRSRRSARTLPASSTPSSENGHRERHRSVALARRRHVTTSLSPLPTRARARTARGFAPGGGDTDLAVATAKNSSHNYNVYVASLTLANVDVATSTDRGKTWSLNPAAATISGADDREWIAADGASKVCISYHDGAAEHRRQLLDGRGPDVHRSVASAIDTGHVYQIGNNEIGNLAIDPKTHDIFQTYSAITTADEIACAPQVGVSAGTCGYHGVYMAVLPTDGGQSFTDYPVYVDQKHDRQLRAPVRQRLGQQRRQRLLRLHRRPPRLLLVLEGSRQDVERRVRISSPKGTHDLSVVNRRERRGSSTSSTTRPASPRRGTSPGRLPEHGEVKP